MGADVISGKAVPEGLYTLFERYAGCSPDSAELLTSSGSSRKYYRLAARGCSIIGAEGADLRENAAFMALSDHFRKAGINVPEVYAGSDDGMYYLQEDLGDLSLFDAVSQGRENGGCYSESEKAMLLKTISALPSIQYDGARGLDFSVCYPEPVFNRRLVMADLNYFKYCFLKTSGIEFNEALLENDFERFADDLLAEDADTFMYRDFQARNVMLKDGKPYFIDFQGGRKGPACYDVASFVWQARAMYPEDFRDRLVRAYLDAAGSYADIDEEHFMERLRLFVLFRMLQVLGAYGFRGNFERKPHFLRSIPYALANLKSVLSDPPADYPYLVPLLEKMVSQPVSAAKPSMSAAPACRDAGGVQLSAGTDCAGTETALEVLIYSFSFRKGIPGDPSGNGGGYVFDCRSLPNPGKYEYYRQFTGMDREVQEFFKGMSEVDDFLGSAFALADAHVDKFLKRGFNHLMICFGCTGGQHRSVYCAEKMAAHLAARKNVVVKLVHREYESYDICRRTRHEA